MQDTRLARTLELIKVLQHTFTIRTVLLRLRLVTLRHKLHGSDDVSILSPTTFLSLLKSLKVTPSSSRSPTSSSAPRWSSFTSNDGTRSYELIPKTPQTAARLMLNSIRSFRSPCWPTVPRCFLFLFAGLQTLQHWWFGEAQSLIIQSLRL